MHLMYNKLVCMLGDTLKNILKLCSVPPLTLNEAVYINF